MERVSRRIPFREFRWLVLASFVAVSLGYLVRPTMVVHPGSGLLGALSVRNFHDAEGAFRWTRGRSTLVISDPGPGVEGRVEVRVSGFRGPGHAAPLLLIQAGSESQRTRPGRRAESFSFPTQTRGWWRSDLEVVFRSETFTPGDEDRRALGVRIYEVRWIPSGSKIQLGSAPVRQLVYTSGGLLLFFVLLVQAGTPQRKALNIGLVVAAIWALGFAFARLYAVVLAPAIFWLLVVALSARVFLPTAATRSLAEVLGDSLRRAIRGLTLWRGRPVAALAVLSAVGGVASYFAHPVIEVDLGSGRETTLAQRFAGLDQEEGVRFRRALPGARINLRDFGTGSQWRIEITAAVFQADPNTRQTLLLARSGGEELTAELGLSWSRHAFVTDASAGFRPGLQIDFPSAAAPLDLRVDRIRIERGRSLPSPRILLILFGASLLLMAAGGATGLSARAATLGAFGILVGELVALAIEPVLVIPFASVFLFISAAALVLASFVTASLAALERLSWLPALHPVALAVATLGFVVWSTVTLFPLYEGGHFVYHSSIAEEIWQGRFMHYYLPSPENMLSHQTHWDNAVIPHSCLYHTVVSPLAAFPRIWFYSLEKIVLAGMLAMMVLAASVLATCFGDKRAGVWAGVFVITLPPSFQLLGLGHLMTLFGMWTATLALSLLVLRFENLKERTTWWWATIALTICFLSYTASLLFAGVVVALTVSLLYRQAPGPTRALAGISVLAAATAFLLYYVHWTSPFLTEALPKLFDHSTFQGGASIWNRVLTLPGRLSFTYQNVWLPLFGLAGLSLAPQSPRRTFLFLWGGILILFSGLELLFNFLLKHHYFVMVPVSVGLGLGARWLSGKGRVGVTAVAIFLAHLVILAFRSALAVAMGNG